MDCIDLTGLDKAEVLAPLYNASHPLGFGVLHFTPEDMTVDEARALLNDPQPTNDIGYPRPRFDFDYLKGRVMKIDLSGDTLDTWGYDRDNGKGAAQRVIERVRKGSAA